MTCIGVFGGTFNPIHYGHLRMAQEVAEVLKLDKVLFVPAGNPPLKNSELAEASDRYEMVKMAIAANSSFLVSDLEVHQKGKSYTVMTLQNLISQVSHENAELFFILGIDAFADFHLWYKPEQLLALTHLVVISRPGFTFTSLVSSPYVPNLSEEDMEKLDKNEIHICSSELSDSNQMAYFCKLIPLGISASLIRKLIRNGKSIKYLLPEEVESYIMKKKLYV
jgi:nicotinate-nucleotide adenylyltransferase